MSRNRDFRVFYRGNPWAYPLLHLLELGVYGLFWGMFYSLSWYILSVGRDTCLPLFKLFLFAVFGMAVIGGFHDYYVITNSERISEDAWWVVFLPEFLVFFLTICFGILLRVMGKREK